MIHIAYWQKHAPYAKYSWQFPVIRNNIIFEIDFGVFSIFLGRTHAPKELS